MFDFLAYVAAVMTATGVYSLISHAQGEWATTNILLTAIAVSLFAIVWKNL